MLRSPVSWSRAHASARRWYSDKARLKVLFGSQLGTAEKYAQVVAMFARAHNFDVELSALDNCPPSTLQRDTLAVILTSTYGNGEFPRNAQQFWNELSESKADLSALRYALFGLGNSHNEQFNEAAKLLDQKLKTLGAKQLAETVLSCELQPNGHDSKFQPWLHSLWGALGTKADSAALPSSYRLELVDSATPSLTPSAAYGFVTATVKANTPLTDLADPDPERAAWSLELDSTFLSYDLLDHVLIQPLPPAPLVDRLLQLLHVVGSTKVRVVPTAAAHAALPLDHQVVTIQDILHTIDISAIPTRTFIAALAQTAGDPSEKAQLEKLSQDMSPGNRYSGLAQKEVFTLVDLLEEFPSVHISLEQLLTNCPIIQPRTYSISSDPRRRAGSLELCYAVATRKHNNNVFRGLCSGYLSGLKVGDRVRVQVQRGLLFNPGDNVPVVGVALGTGIGPFRALLQRRLAAKRAGEPVAPVTLFFGFRHLAKDFLFREELQRLQSQGVLRLVPSCSHDDPQHFETPIEKLAQHSETVYEALARRGATFIYCGLSGTVPIQVEHALRRVVERESQSKGSANGNARAFLQKLRKSGHYQEESYSVDTDVENVLASTYAPPSSSATTGATKQLPFAEQYADAKMFCFQCEQTHQHRGCTTVGVCGKTPDVAALQDLLVEGVKVLGWYCHHLRALRAATGAQVPELVPESFLREANHLSLEAMFATLTNVNFDATRFVDYLRRCRELTDTVERKYAELCRSLGQQQQFPHATGLPDAAEITAANVDGLVERGRDVGVVAQFRASAGCGGSEEAVGVCELLVYGLKGLCAYAHHSLVNHMEDERVYQYLHEACAFLLSDRRHDLAAAVGMALRCGEVNVTVLDLLYRSNTSSFGKPEPTRVPVRPTPGKCILVSGHDLVALDSLLRATAGTGINVYTHGEMLPCHSYPQLKQYGNLVGHFGGAWNRQSVEFPYFPGPIVMTTNCLTEPKDSYRARLYTVAAVGWQGIPHLTLAGEDLQKVDWTPVLTKARECRGFTTGERAFQYPQHGAVTPQPESFTVGFGHEVVLGAAPTVLKEVASGNIKRFFVIGGCDGYEGERSYYTDLAQRLPPESVVLTLGCGKFRLNHLDKGTIGDTGIPRILDMGQCNDAFGAVQVALALSKALNCQVSDLPLSIVLSWFEQKAIVVLLTLLHLGIKPIRVGPSLPAFLRPAVVDVLVRDFGVRLVGSAEEDVKTMCSAVGAS